jgi:Zn-dependent protease with chaperone function/Flp pilus assembly protein TadD
MLSSYRDSARPVKITHLATRGEPLQCCFAATMLVCVHVGTLRIEPLEESFVMHSLLLALLLAQLPVPAATDARLLRWTQQAHEHWMAGRHEAAIAAYDRILAAAPSDQWKANALGPRATLLLEVGRPEEALADAREYAALFPTAVYPLELQVQALQQLGRNAEAQTVQRQVDRQVDRLYETYQVDLLPGFDDWGGQSLVSNIVGGVMLALVAAFLFGSLLLINIAIGRRQRREGRGTWLRLIGVSAAVCGLQLVPFVVCALIYASQVASHRGYEIPLGAVVIGTINLLVLFSALGPTARFVHSKDPLPLVEEEAFLARVAELARRMGLPVPVVRLLPTGGGELQAQALAGGLVAPSLVVADGILHRLDPDERDATMAHELAHLANRSLWWLTAAAPIAATAGVVFAFWFPFGLAVAFAFAVWIGVRHLISRYFEYDCDRRAAEVLGYRTTYSALSKIHAAGPLRDKGWLSFLVFATATHPSRAQRLAAVHDASPPEDRPEVTWSQEDLLRRRRAGWIAVAVWLTSLVAVPLWAWHRPDSQWPTVVLALVGLTPWLAILLALRSYTRDVRRRMVARTRYRRWVPLLLFVAVVGWIAFHDRLGLSLEGVTQSEWRWSLILQSLAMSLVLPLLVLWFLWSLVRGSGVQQIEQQVAIAMQTRDFAKVFELADSHPKALARSAILRHSLGFAAAMTGDRERAIEVLEALRRDEPGFAESVLVLAMVHVDEGCPAEALPLIEEVQARLPDDPTPLALCAHVQHLLGRLEDAQKDVDRALEIKPESGNGHAIAAWIALSRGDREQAEQLLDRAEEFDPATAFIELAKAELALAGDDPAAARRQIERAIAASDANPYALLQNQTRRLAERLPAEGSDRDAGGQSAAETASPDASTTT